MAATRIDIERFENEPPYRSKVVLTAIIAILVEAMPDSREREQIAKIGYAMQQQDYSGTGEIWQLVSQALQE